MPVYVDNLIPTTPTKRWPYEQSCHLYADTLQELHELAQSIGLKREWFQDHHLLPHYDLTPSKRKAAIKAGAKPKDRHHLREYMR